MRLAGHTPLRDTPGYIKEPRTSPELLARGAHGQHRAALRRDLRKAGSLFPHNRKRAAKRALGVAREVRPEPWRAAHAASAPYRRKKVLAIIEKMKMTPVVR